MPIFDQYFLFLAKLSTLSLAIILISIILNQSKNDQMLKPKVTILNKKQLAHHQAICDKLKKYPHFKNIKQSLKQQEKQLRYAESHLFILDFKGDIHASCVATLRKEIDLILAISKPDDEVLIRIESRGGTVTGYGLAASQVHRLRKSGLRLVISIDQIAASGGYLVASLAHEIIASPFACIGSIGVVLEQPNFNKLLHSYGIEYNQVTSGQYKRTLSLFGKNTKDAENKVKHDLEITHQLFKDYVTQYRDLDIDQVATGETWQALVAHEKGLVDNILTSDEYLQKHQLDKLILHISTPEKSSLSHMLKQKAVSFLQYLE